METKANYVMIGLLTLVTIAGAFGFVYWFQHSGGVGDRTMYRVLFDGSAQGLRTGGSVLFNGVRVGEVTSLQLNSKNPRQVVAIINVGVDTPVRSDTTASLSFKGFTGIAALALKGGDPNATPLKPPPGEQLAVISVEAEATQDVTESAREVLRKIDTVVTENQETMRTAIKNIDAFTAVLARNSERFDRILGGIENLTGGPDGKGEVAETLKSFHALAENLDKRTADITKDFRAALATLERTVRNFDRNPQRIIFGNPAGQPQR